MAGHRIQPSRGTVTPSSYWPRSSAKVAAHPGADRFLTDISTIIRERFWEVQYGAVAEGFTSEWQLFDSFRGQNPTCV
jgi:mannose/cellobiose epimerase-like protein (N-acyl-D-glucosamine 2-epimerase family)